MSASDCSSFEISTFNQLSLDPQLLKALNDVGYETPSPIQAKTIPLLLNGRDVLGQAQTGTGKTAAFALPILSRIKLQDLSTQVLVLTPTRELAIQVAEAFQKYARYLSGFHVVPIYGGQDYSGQLRALKRGTHVVVGTPGRVMDHMRRGSLKLDTLNALVLDEADEMLRMGFIDDVEWILEKTPKSRQIALFSATMPKQIKQIADKYLNNPESVIIKVKTATADTIRQRYWLVSGTHKLDALTRILETEPFDAIIIFVRTKISTQSLADSLEARGYAVAALNGDITQKNRELCIEQLKQGKLDIVVATDVAARGLDVSRVSHVINYDIPSDTDAYIHRIGRTGRARKSGDAILFVAPREKRMLSSIEKATNQKIDVMELPSTELINDKRIAKFNQRISETLASEDYSFYTQLVERYQRENDVPALEIAAALAKLLQGDEPFLVKANSNPKTQRTDSHKSDKTFEKKSKFKNYDETEASYSKKNKSNNKSFSKDNAKIRPEPRSKSYSGPAQESLRMESYRLEVGKQDNIQAGNIVGAIANEAGLEGKYIGQVRIFDDYSTVDLPEGMPKDIFQNLKHTRVGGRPLQISRLSKKTNQKSKVKDERFADSKKPKKNRGAKANKAKPPRKK